MRLGTMHIVYFLKLMVNESSHWILQENVLQKHIFHAVDILIFWLSLSHSNSRTFFDFSQHTETEQHAKI